MKESMEKLFAQLSEEQKEKFRNCQNMDEVMKLVDEEELTQLTDDQLEFLASGGCGLRNVDKGPIHRRKGDKKALI